MSAPFRILALDNRPRDGFTCTSAALDHYFRRQVTQDMRRRVTACFIAEHRESGRIAGFYTLSAASILLDDLAPRLARRLPRYPDVPAARLGRLAVDRRFAGQRLGAALLADAVRRAAASEVTVHALIVDAKDASAAAFYRHHGLMAHPSVPGRLMAPLASLLP